VEKRKKELVNKIQRKEARVAVVGLGHVGLPTAAVFADAGFTVIGVDVKEEVVAAISSGRNLIREPGLSKILERVTKNGRLKAITNILAAAREADVIIICVQTPLTKDGKQNRTYLEKACKDVAKAPLKGKLMIVESTVAPGTMKDIADVLEEESGLKCEEDFWLAFCPERIAPGSAIRELMESNRIVSGYDSESARIAAELFKFVTKGKIITTDCGSAEVAKLAENTFRYVNIAFANELALICERLGVDVTEVTRLANSHSRVNIHTSGCGVGGPCLPKDPYLLLCSAEKRGFTSKVIKSSGEVNKHMPRHTTELVVKALKNVGKDMKNSRVAVLGAAYKAEVDDARNSPAKDVVKELRHLRAQVVVYDPYCNEHFGVERAQDLTMAVKGADCLVIVTDHGAFRGLMLKEIKRLMNEKPVIVDGRQVVNSTKARREGFTYFRIGYGSN
jgi:UDP-N-acetyl-D-mannosaminuronic acid dehydrogenase